MSTGFAAVAVGLGASLHPYSAIPRPAVLIASAGRAWWERFERALA